MVTIKGYSPFFTFVKDSIEIEYFAFWPHPISPKI
jgi:hypothetical protein